MQVLSDVRVLCLGRIFVVARRVLASGTVRLKFSRLVTVWIVLVFSVRFSWTKQLP